MSSFTIIASLTLITFIGVLGVVGAPEQAASIMSFTGSIVVMLIASMWGQQRTHDIVNGRMDELLSVVGKSEHAKGVIEGREEVEKSE